MELPSSWPLRVVGEVRRGVLTPYPDAEFRKFWGQNSASSNGWKSQSGCPLLKQDRRLLLRQDRYLLLRQDRCLLLKQDRCLLLKQDRCLLLKQLIALQLRARTPDQLHRSFENPSDPLSPSILWGQIRQNPSASTYLGTGTNPSEPQSKHCLGINPSEPH